jgi:hypothetical protein
MRRRGLAWLVLFSFLAVQVLTGCGGGVSLSNLFTATLTPSPTVTLTPSFTPSSTETASPNPATATPTETATETHTRTPSRTPTASATITPGPSPTRTRTSTATRIPTRTRTPSKTPTVTKTPTITNTPTPAAPRLYISRPGLLSRVTSPIQAEVYAVPGEDGLVRVELIGEDGRLIARQVKNFSQYAGRSIAFYPEIPFEIQTAAETARLQVTTNDRAGRVVYQNTVEVVLLSVGRSEVFAPALTQEPIILRFPEEGGVISGGTLLVSGLARPVNDQVLTLELVAENGAVIQTKQFTVEPPTPEISHSPFFLEVPYQVSEPTNVRLTFRQSDPRIPGSVFVSSWWVVLEP